MSGRSPVPSPSDRFVIRREKQVSWFDTRQLAATGSQAFAATIIGSMSGRREIMAALDPGTSGPFDHSEAEELWIDYIADTGDGWNSTESIAWLAGRDGIVLERDGSETPQPVPADCFTEGLPEAGDSQMVLPGGELLILGGDQVYPTASAETYQHRFIDPLRCARWYCEGGRKLFAIPGNHDWYDGLTSFIRLFCQSSDSRRWFGCWQAQQRRSYFSLALPHGWWMWGVDMALEEDLDPPQYDYFRSQAKRLAPGDRLILVVPSPTWLKRSSAKESGVRDIAADKLGLIMRLAREIEIPLVITGDLHFYARHEDSSPEPNRHYIVCGSGGAFGLGTLQVEGFKAAGDGGEPKSFELKASFPDAKDSEALRQGVLGFPLKNPAFTLMLTAAQAITLWLLSGAYSGWLQRLVQSELTFAQLCALMGDALGAAIASPALLLWLLLLLAGFGAFALSGRPPFVAKWKAWAWGLLHGLLQLAGAFVCIWIAAQIVGQLLVLGFEEQWRLVTFGIGDDWAILALAAPLIYFYCGFLFGLYLLLGHKFIHLHDQEVFSAQGIEDYKGFLRMKISKAGLEVFPIGLRRHVSEWRAAEGVELSTRSSGIFRKVQQVEVPAGAQRVVDPCEPLSPHLIEQPVFIPGGKRP